MSRAGVHAIVFPLAVYPQPVSQEPTWGLIRPVPKTHADRLVRHDEPSITATYPPPLPPPSKSVSATKIVFQQKPIPIFVHIFVVY